LGLNLGKVLLDIDVALVELLLGELSDLARLKAFLVLEKAFGTAKEAIKRDHLLEEAELGIGTGLLIFLVLGLDSLLKSRMDLSVDLRGREGFRFHFSFGSSLNHCFLHHTCNFLDMRLSIDTDALNGVIRLLNAKQ
jgi:hypothetical protein